MEPGSHPIPARQFPTLPGYEIHELAGRGGQATVYKARHKELKRTVALKVMHRGDVTEAAAERFLLEARTAARLSHAGIVPVFESGREGNDYYFAMDYVEGKALDRYVADAELPLVGVERK